MHEALRDRMHPLMQELARCIETVWRQYLELSPYVVPEDLGYVEGSLEGERLTIENHCYQAPQFRKLHLELAYLSNGLNILHCVMFPRSEYAIPIFGTDLVGGKNGINAAIADLSPISSDRLLPIAYQQALVDLPYVTFREPRSLPEWGDIFSDYCLFARLGSAEEEQKFLQRVTDFLTIHCQIAQRVTPLTAHREIERVLAGQQNYCTKQQQNDKTRRVLEKSFGTEWADRYMTTMLFDMERS